ncbi:MAG: flagellar biosynthesis regulator FlaF [Paracoccus sp. (in: a-proteobacteria)]|uniref:flagellar biosynthesis regulator FlaF n=1 Tax=Paracoccus sp. TaxID=267 RepID=UPI00391A0EFF
MPLNAVTPLSQHGYNNGALRCARDIEYDAFSRVTRMLRQCGRRCTTPQAVQAVHLNTELWTLLAADLAEPGNALPDETRAGLISLAGFCIRHGHKAMTGEASTDVLIDINMSIMKGLRGEVPA